MFPSHYFQKDRGFTASCKVLSFIRLENILESSLSSTLEHHLQPVCGSLWGCSKAFTFSDKFLLLKESLDKIVEIVSALTDKIIGSEELHPILTFCLLKASPLNWISNLAFLKILVSEKEWKGEIGFALTKVEISTSIIENADWRLFDCGNFAQNVLKNEVLMGYHLMKNRLKKDYKLKQISSEVEIFI